MSTSKLAAIAALVALAGCSSGDGPLAAGSLNVTISGLPSDAASLTIYDDAGSYRKDFIAPALLTDIPAGTYNVETGTEDRGTATYTAEQIYTVKIMGSLTANLAIDYTLSSGVVELTIDGLPAGTPANVVVKNGCSVGTLGCGYPINVLASASRTIGNLRAGNYSVIPRVVAVNATTYGSLPVLRTVPVPASLTPVPVEVTYAAMSGQLVLNVTGIPDGAAPSVFVTGPFGFSIVITSLGTTTLPSLPLGTYLVRSFQVPTPSAVFAAGADQTIVIAPDAQAATANVAYKPTSGSLTVTLGGLPDGVSGRVAVYGPQVCKLDPFLERRVCTVGPGAAIVTATTTINNLNLGGYTLKADTVTSGTSRYAPTPASQSAAVVASLTPTIATVTYSLVP